MGRGARMDLHMKEDHTEMGKEMKIKEIVKKHSFDRFKTSLESAVIVKAIWIITINVKAVGIIATNVKAIGNIAINARMVLRMKEDQAKMARRRRSRRS